MTPYQAKTAGRAWRLAARAGKVSPFDLENWHPSAAVIAMADQGKKIIGGVPHQFKNLTNDRRAGEAIANSRVTPRSPAPYQKISINGEQSDIISQAQIKKQRVLSLPMQTYNMGEDQALVRPHSVIREGINSGAKTLHLSRKGLAYDSAQATESIPRKLNNTIWKDVDHPNAIENSVNPNHSTLEERINSAFSKQSSLSPYQAYMNKQALFGKEDLQKAKRFLINKATREVSPEYMQAIKDHMEPKIKNKVLYQDIENPLRGAMRHGDRYIPETVIYAHPTRSPALLAHELGHAMAGDTNRKYLPKIRAASKIISQLGQTAELMSPEYLRPAVKKVMRPIALAAQLPTLYEESRASYEGLKALKQVHGTKEMLRAIPTMALGLASYGMGAAEAGTISGPIGTATSKGVKGIGQGLFAAGKAILRK